MPRTKRVKIEEPVSIKVEQSDSPINQPADQTIVNSADHLGDETKVEVTKPSLSVTWVYQKSELESDQSNNQTAQPNNLSFQHSLTELIEQNSEAFHQLDNQNSSNQSPFQTIQSTDKSFQDLPLLFQLPVPSDCSLSSIVCSYGFFRLPPNTWIAPSSQFQSLTQTIKHSDALSNQQVTNLSIANLGPVPNGCLIRALRFGERLYDAVYVIVTEETINQANDRISEHSANNQVKSESEPDVHLGSQNDQDMDSDDILSYKTDTVICVRALFPPRTASLPQYSESTQSVKFVFDSAALCQLERQVGRMLRLEPRNSISHPSGSTAHSDAGSFDHSSAHSSITPNPYAGFYRHCPAARARGFARLFRSPLLFEDAVKTITLCNVNWTGTIAMNRNLCQAVGVGQSMRLDLKVVVPDMRIQSDGQSNNQAIDSSVDQSNNALGSETQANVQDTDYLVTDITLGVFPSPLELSLVDDESLRSSCRVGYRSGRLIGLANMCVDGSLDREIDQRMSNNQTTAEIRKFIQTINGFGPFASNNLIALIGRFDAHAFDSETIRHMREHHLVDQKFELTSAQLMKHAQQHYSFEKYGEFIFLVYWFELWCGYERRVNTVAHKWTDRQFASFSGGGPKPAIDPSTNQSTPLSAKGKPLQHWQLVAQQTRKRKQAGLTSNSQRKRSAKVSSDQPNKQTKKRSKSASGRKSHASVEDGIVAIQSVDEIVAPPPSSDAVDIDLPSNGRMTRSQSRALRGEKEINGTNRQTNRKLTVPEIC